MKFLFPLLCSSTMERTLVPVIQCACDCNEPRVQDEFLRQLPPLLEILDYNTIKRWVAPRLHALCMNTTAAPVRINSIVAMAHMVPKVDTDELAKMCDTIR